MNVRDVRKTPAYLEGVKFFDMWDWGWGMPSDPHASENLRHAVALLAAADTQENRDFLDLVVKRYLGEKYQESILEEAQRIAKNAARSAVKNAGEVP